MQALAILIVILTMTGCSQFVGQKDIEGNFTCQPIDATGCIGWAK